MALAHDANFSNDGVALPSRPEFFRLRPFDSDIPGVIARGGVLLVARFVLLIDNDHAQIRRGGEDRRPCPDDHIGISLRDHLPIAMALGALNPLCRMATRLNRL